MGLTNRPFQKLATSFSTTRNELRGALVAKSFSPRSILEEMLNLLGDGHWTQGTMALDSKGTPVSVESFEACVFCLEGALIKAAHLTGALKAKKSDAYAVTRKALTAEITKQLAPPIPGILPWPALWRFNDDKKTTYNTVIALVETVRDQF